MLVVEVRWCWMWQQKEFFGIEQKSLSAIFQERSPWSTIQRAGVQDFIQVLWKYHCIMSEPTSRPGPHEMVDHRHWDSPCSYTTSLIYILQSDPGWFHLIVQFVIRQEHPR
jgi:hypothetical protein